MKAGSGICLYELPCDALYRPPGYKTDHMEKRNYLGKAKVLGVSTEKKRWLDSVFVCYDFFFFKMTDRSMCLSVGMHVMILNLYSFSEQLHGATVRTHSHIQIYASQR